MKAYKKRAKGSWQVGKGCKSAEGPERQFSKREIQQQLDEDEEDYLDRYHKGARTKNMKMRLEYRVEWYQWRIDTWTRLGTSDSMMSYFRSALAQAKKELKKYLEEKKGQL